METISCYLSMVSDVIWAAIIASFLTFTSVLLTNRYYSKQQQAQIEHEKAQKDADRKHELRQSVYLSAVEELTLAQQHLMNLSNIDIAVNNPADKLTGFFVATTKACLVASDETAKTITELLTAYSETFFSLLAKTFPIQNARIDRNIQNDAYERYSAEVSRILASMTQFNEESKADSVVWNALSRNLDFNRKQADIAAEARRKSWDQLNRLKVSFAKKALSESKAIGMLTIPAIVAIRLELGIPSDIDSYHAEFKKRFSQMEVQLDKFLAEVGGDNT